MNTTANTQPTAQVVSGTPLTGRVAVVTGASSGIGEATALRFAELGAKVALIARRGDRLEALQERIRANGGTALALPTDVTDRAAVLAAARRVEEVLGPVDLVFANAGVQLIAELTSSPSSTREIPTGPRGPVALRASRPQLVPASSTWHPRGLGRLARFTPKG